MNSFLNFADNKPFIEHKYGAFEIRNGILFGYYKPNLHITLEIAQYIVNTRLDYQPNIILPCVVNATTLEDVSREAREYFAKKGNYNLAAMSILSNSIISRVVGNFYLKVSQPNIPTKLFKTEKDAIKWLEKYK